MTTTVPPGPQIPQMAPAPRNRNTTVGPLLPQVNLLPPEVRAARGLRKIKRWLAIGLIVVVLLCAGMFAYGKLLVSQAADELVSAQKETAVLAASEAKYAEVPQVLAALDAVKSARILGMSTEVQWKVYFDAITAVLPAGVTIESLTVTGATPMTAASLPADPLQAPSVGMITFTGKSATLPDTGAWYTALNSIPGFADAWVSNAAIGSDDTGDFYTVESSVQFSELAFANRFVAVDGSK
ncbi:PilN domain-containing protein [Pengzhenrongella phosphoraccumulans]|uniref:PilN domain-containing protein n=1 Tax=Pengzhenrongella phosphoraccumulans TaxID=3114394 RepID=UPI00388FAEBF